MIGQGGVRKMPIWCPPHPAIHAWVSLSMSGETAEEEGRPVFGHVAEFWTRGVVMNLFLLDPGVRLLSAFVSVSRSNTIGLYVLLDWELAEYVFVNTGIECVRVLAFLLILS